MMPKLNTSNTSARFFFNVCNIWLLVIEEFYSSLCCHTPRGALPYSEKPQSDSLEILSKR